MSSAEETLTELQAWLKSNVATGRDFLKHASNDSLTDAFYRGTVIKTEQILDWLETKRSGNG